jgi:hypothetical protein
VHGVARGTWLLEMLTVTRTFVGLNDGGQNILFLALSILQFLLIRLGTGSSSDPCT